MEAPLHTLLWVFYLEMLLAAAFACYLWFVTRKRHLFLKVTAAEAAFWLKLGLPKSLVEKIRRLEEGRIYVFSLWVVLSIILSIAFIAGAQYLHKRSQHGFAPKPHPTNEQPHRGKRGRPIEHTQSSSLPIARIRGT